jgi:hypothetical protein
MVAPWLLRDLATARGTGNRSGPCRYICMDQLTPHEAEILRLWGVIRKLKAHQMTDKEEALFGEVYQEFTRLGRFHREPVEEEHVWRTPETLREVLVQQAARYMRALQNCVEEL